MRLRPSPHRPAPRHPRARIGLALWLVALMAALAVVTPAATLAASQTMAPACDGINVRSSTSTSSTIRARLGAGATVTVAAAVSGGAWSTICPTAKSGSGWYRISAINGRSVSSLYGVSYVYAAHGVLTATPANGILTAAPATGTSAPATGDVFGPELMRLVNLDRVALGRPAYLIDGRLAEIARDAAFACPTQPTLQLLGRSRDMADRGYFSHTVPGCYVAGTTTPYSALAIVRTVFGYTGARSEIIAWNAHGWHASTYKIGCDVNGANCVGGTTTTPYTVGLTQRIFMSSSVHRAAELNSHERFGCGSATVPGTIKTYFTCLFANGAPTTSSAPTATPAPTEPTATPAPSPAPTEPTATPAPSPAGTTMAPACDGINVRSSTSTSSTIRARLGAGATVTVAAAVSGGAWSTICPTAKSGSGWYRISAINGRSVSSLYGVSYVYAANGVLTATPAP